MSLGHGPYRLCMMMVGVCGSGVCGHWCCCCGRGGRCIVFLFWKIIVRWCLLLAVNGRGCMTANMLFFLSECSPCILCGCTVTVVC